MNSRWPTDWVTNIGAATTFSYDADGNRVKRVGPGGTTFYIGDHSELIPNVKWTHYYTFNGQRIAVRDGWNGLVALLQGDHLGSASMTTDANAPGRLDLMGAVVRILSE